MPTLRATFIIIIVFLISCTPPRQLEMRSVQITGAKPNESSFESVLLNVNVQVYNPNNFNLKVWHAEASCIVKNQPAGTMSLDTMIVIPALAAIEIPLQIVIKTAPILSGGLDVILGKGIPYSLTGTAKAGKGSFKWNIPFTQSGTFTTKDLKMLGF